MYVYNKVYLSYLIKWNYIIKENLYFYRFYKVFCNIVNKGGEILEKRVYIII